MSELNVFNDSPASPLNPDWPFGGEATDNSASFTPRNGPSYRRELGPAPHIFNLSWTERELWIADSIRQWEAQYRNTFFTFYDWERNRGYSGRFAGRPQIQGVGFNKWNITAQFVEMPGLAMKEYPGKWQGVDDPCDSYFLDERNELGVDQVKLSGAGWAWYEPWHYWNTGQVNAAAEWLYCGYGFRVWSWREPKGAIAEVSLDGAVVGNVDLYFADWGPKSLVFTKQDVPLGMHRVKLRHTGTWNPLNVDPTPLIYADSLEVMQ